MTIRDAGIKIAYDAIGNNGDASLDAVMIIDALIEAGWLGPCDTEGCVAVGPHRYHVIVP